jgi:hypothetical protein
VLTLFHPHCIRLSFDIGLDSPIQPGGSHPLPVICRLPDRHRRGTGLTLRVWVLDVFFGGGHLAHQRSEIVKMTSVRVPRGILLNSRCRTSLNPRVDREYHLPGVSFASSIICRLGVDGGVEIIDEVTPDKIRGPQEGGSARTERFSYLLPSFETEGIHAQR